MYPSYSVIQRRRRRRRRRAVTIKSKTAQRRRHRKAKTQILFVILNTHVIIIPAYYSARIALRMEC